MAGNKDVKRGIVIYIDGKEVKNNAKAIEAEMRKVKKEIDGCTLGSEEYIKATKRYRELNSILNEHRNQLREVKKENKDLMTSVNEWWSKWQLALGAAAAGITAVGLALSKFRKEMNEKESAQANLKALTGLDDESIAWLTKQAEELSTSIGNAGLRVTQSSKEILDAYMLVGSAKPELLANKDALNAVTIEAMRLSQAAKMDLKDAVDGVTLALNQYGAGADEAAKYVNVLAAGSKFGAAGVESQTEAIVKAGVAAAVAKVPIEGLVGSIETLAEKGIKGSIAGTGLKTFFLKLEGMADDVRPSVVGLDKALDNLRAKNLSVAETQKMFGMEAYTVAQALISGADAFKQYTANVTDTNTAIEQAAINSETAEAKLAQMKNQFSEQGQILVKELNPAITKFVSLGMNSTKMLVELTRFLTEHKVTLGLTTAAIGVYVAFINRKIIADKLAVLWTNTLNAAQAGLTATLMKNPWGVALVAIAAVTGAIIEYNNKVEDATKKGQALENLNKKTAEQFDKEKAHIERLNSVIRDNNANLNTRKKALEELKKIVPGYLGELSREGELIRDNKKAIDDWLVSKEKEIRLKAAEEDLEETIRNKRKKERELEKAKREAEQARENQRKAAGSVYGGSQGSANFNVGQVTGADKRVENIENEIQGLDNDIKALKNEINKGNGVTSNIVNNDDGGNDGSGSVGTTTTYDEDAESKRIKAETTAIEAEMKKREAILKQEYASGIKSRQQYSDGMQEIEIERINRLLQIARLEPEKIAELQNKLADFAVKAREQLDALDFSSTFDEDEGEQLYNEYTRNLDKLNEKQEEQINVLRNNLSLRNITQAQFDQKKQELDVKFTNEQEALWNDYVEKLLKSQSDLIGNTENNLEDLTETTERNIKLFNDTLKPLAETIGSDLVDSVKQALEDGKDPIKAALKAILKDVVNAIQKMMIAYVANRTIANVGTLGYAGLAKAAGEIALISAAGAGLNALIDSFADGGYTRKGNKYTPAGIVHAGEFVATQEAVNNPAVKEVLDVINAAQRNGNIANLSSSDLNAVSGRSSTNSSISQNNSIVIEQNKEMNVLLKQCTEAMIKVKNRFDLPIIAQTYATGKHGTIEATEEVNRMKRNAGR